MGRVYNALIKADRLTDRQRPIGQPASDTGAKRQRDAERQAVRPSPVDSASAPAFDFGHESQDAMFNNANSAALFDSDSSAAPTNFDYSIALSEATGARRTAEPALPPTDEAFAAPLPRRAAVPPAPAPPVFEEPGQVVNIKHLAIAPHIAALAGGDALAAERYRTLAVRLSMLATRRKIKSLAVTSAEAGEGKSTVAASLAWTLARRGERRVLLLDANASAASIHQLLQVAPARGWLDFSDAPAQLTAAMARIDPNGLYVMTARGASQAADADNRALDEALLSGRFEKLLASLSSRFDLIIMDTPALCDSAEAQQLAAIADGCVLVARAGRTPHQRISEAVALMPQERRLGVVLNECEVAEATARRGKRSLMGRLFRR